MQANCGEALEVTFTCSHCKHQSSQVMTKSRWQSSTAFRCPRCGSAYHVEQGIFTVISPCMLPWTSTGQLSPWYGGEYAPAVLGWYECCAQSDARCKLYWNNHAWMYLGETVGPIHKWRGKWK